MAAAGALAWIRRDGVNSQYSEQIMSEMTQSENLTGVETAAPTSAATPATSETSTDFTTPSVVSADPQPPKRTYTDEDVNHIVRKKKESAERAGYEKGRTEALAELQRQQAESTAQTSQATTQAPAMTTQVQGQTTAQQQQVNPQDFQKMIGEGIRSELERVRTEQQNQMRYNDLVSRLQVGINSYPDFSDKVSELGLHQVDPRFLDLVLSVDNTADVLYDIASNDTKLSQILSSLQFTPNIAAKQIQKLAASIKNNRTAAQAKTANEPLSQITHSNKGLGDNGDPSKMRVNDLKRQPWLKA